VSRPAPGYANRSEPIDAPAKRVPTPARVGLPRVRFRRARCSNPWEAPHDHPQHWHRCHRRRRHHRRHRPARLTPHTRRSRKESSGRSLDSRQTQPAAPDGFRNASSSCLEVASAHRTEAPETAAQAEQGGGPSDAGGLLRRRGTRVGQVDSGYTAGPAGTDVPGASSSIGTGAGTSLRRGRLAPRFSTSAENGGSRSEVVDNPHLRKVYVQPTSVETRTAPSACQEYRAAAGRDCWFHATGNKVFPAGTR